MILFFLSNFSAVLLNNSDEEERVVPMSMFEISIPQSVDLNMHYNRWINRQVNILFVSVDK